MRYLDAIKEPKTALHHPAGANTAAVVTVAASAEERWGLTWIAYSLDGTPATSLKIEVGGSTVFEIDLSQDAERVDFLEWSTPRIVTDYNEALVVTLGAVSAVTGKLNIGYV